MGKSPPAFFGKRVMVEGILCQSETEAAVLRNLLRHDVKVSRGRRFKTSHGYYTSDFETPEFQIECKSLGTWRVCLGLESYMKNSRDPRLGEMTSRQFAKMREANGVCPLAVVVILKDGQKLPDSKNEHIKVIGVTRNRLDDPTYSIYDELIGRSDRDGSGHQQVQPELAAGQGPRQTDQERQ